MDRVILAVTVGIMAFIVFREALRALMASWHEEMVGESDALSEACENHERDRQFFFWMPILFSLVIAGTFYIFWYQYLPR
jgi:hypothetical protein